MSPLSLRRYRAERLLRQEFDALRGTVLAAVRSRLRSHGITLDETDLEACYSTAWQGLYAALLGGQEIQNPAGWLVIVAYRRAIDEQRARHAEVELPAQAAAGDRDLAAEIDDRVKLRQLVEGLGSRLSERERQAAALCYLQGLSRAEAARRMGIAPRRMKRLMEGGGPGKPGVAAKMGALAATISEGRFCEDQASLMRALAFGVLDPEGERHRIAIAHRRSCPACRAYVLSLRGLSAVLPPAFLPGLLSGVSLPGASGGGASDGGATGAVSGGAPSSAGASAAGLAGSAGGFARSRAGLGLGGAKATAIGALLTGAAAVLIGIPLHQPSRRHVRRAARFDAAGADARADRAGNAAQGAAPPGRRATRSAHVSAPRSRPAPRLATSATAPALREFGFEGRRSPPAGSAPAAAAVTPGGRGEPASAASREFGIEPGR